MLGYPCLNRTLRDRDEPLRCNRDMQRKTWESRGLPYASELTLQNFTDLYEILRWNVEHDVYFYRCTSDLVPWNSQFDVEELPDYEEIAELAERCGEFVEEHGMRFTFHPDYWCKLASPSDDTVENSLNAVEYHASWLDLLGLDRSPYYSINVHIGATYGDKAATAERFREAVDRLSPGARAHLTVENDDEESLWSVPELVEAVGDPIGVPVVFDYHHHSFADRGLTYREAFERARTTWGDVKPITHYSEPASLHGEDTRPQTHSAYVYDLPEWLRAASDVMLEADQKELAVFRAREADPRRFLSTE
ncbi:UV DNA damage repair endonuclease UvsE [Halogeometricum limi]|uniref:UV-damage endonuclease n=1 Tax=Halogeometricum limi TaxID=555875 RepID=A0A1I6IET5_9EURY|nr:UV DNA damage repair endonuclease UvsE [Halogeometricum limi]SFR65206.1 UV-damage endonuclease [Halogeometricum limi]